MGLVRFLGLRTYSVELRRDLEVLEKNFNDLVNRTAPLFSNEPAASFDQTTNNASPLINHAHRHATSGSLLPATGTDPIGPFNFNWYGTHVWSPASNITPITIKATGSLTDQFLQRWQPLINESDVVTREGDVGIGTTTPTAELTIRARGAGPAQIGAISPGPTLWLDAPTSLTSLGDGGVVNYWPDISGSGRHFENHLVVGGPLLSTTTYAIGGQPAVYLNDATRGMDIITGADYTITGGYTVGIVWKASSNGVATPFNLFGHTLSVAGNEGINLPSSSSAAAVRVFYNEGASGPGNALSSTFTPTSGSIHCTIVRRNADNSHTVIHDGVDISSGGYTSSTRLLIRGLFSLDSDSPANTTNALAELIVFAQTLSASDTNTLINYFAAKYGTSTTTSSATDDLQTWETVSGAIDSIVDQDINFGLGTASPAAKLHIVKTTEQLRIGYDGSGYYTTTVDSTGSVVFDAVGSSPDFTFNDPVNIVGTGSSLYLPYTTTSTTGVIFKGGVPFLHDFTNPTGFTDASVDSLANARNIFLGFKAGNFTLSGTSSQGRANVAIGHYAAPALTTGIQNVAIGWDSLKAATSARYNFALGTGALQSNISSDSNVAIGSAALYSTTGNNNVAIGDSAGDDNAAGNQNIYIGSLADGTTSGLSNSIAIGYGALVDASNKTVISNTSTTLTEVRGDLGARNQVSGFMGTLDFSAITANRRYYFQDPNTNLVNGYVLTGAGSPTEILIVGPSGSDLITGTTDVGTSGVDATLPVSYSAQAGFTKTFHANTEVVDFRNQPGSMQLLMGDIGGGPSGNGYLSISVAGALATYDIVGTGTQSHTFNETIIGNHATNSVNLGVSGRMTSNVADAAGAKVFKFQNTTTLTSGTDRWYFSFEDASGNQLMSLRADGSWEIGGGGATAGYLNVSPSTTRTEGAGIFMNPTLNGAGNSSFNLANFTSSGALMVPKVGAAGGLNFAGMVAGPDFTTAISAGLTGAYGVLTGAIRSSSAAPAAGLTHTEAAGVKIVGLPSGTMNMGTFTNYYGAHIDNSFRGAPGSGSSITTGYGLFITQQTRATTNYGIWLANATSGYKAIVIRDADVYIGSNATGELSFNGTTYNVLFVDNEIVSYDDDMVTY